MYSPYGYEDIDYLTIFEFIVLPLIEEVNPEMIFIASGFDACRDEPIWNFNLSH